MEGRAKGVHVSPAIAFSRYHRRRRRLPHYAAPRGLRAFLPAVRDRL